MNTPSHNEHSGAIKAGLAYTIGGLRLRVIGAHRFVTKLTVPCLELHLAVHAGLVWIGRACLCMEFCQQLVPAE